MFLPVEKQQPRPAKYVLILLFIYFFGKKEDASYKDVTRSPAKEPDCVAMPPPGSSQGRRRAALPP